MLGFQGKASQFYSFSFCFLFLFSFFLSLKDSLSFIQGSRHIKGGQKYQAGLLQGLGGKVFFQPINEI